MLVTPPARVAGCRGRFGTPRAYGLYAPLPRPHHLRRPLGGTIESPDALARRTTVPLQPSRKTYDMKPHTVLRFAAATAALTFGLAASADLASIGGADVQFR